MRAEAEWWSLGWKRGQMGDTLERMEDLQVLVNPMGGVKGIAKLESLGRWRKSGRMATSQAEGSDAG